MKKQQVKAEKKAVHPITLGERTGDWHSISRGQDPIDHHQGDGKKHENDLFRRFFAKKTGFTTVSDEDIAKVEHLINSRPRKRLKGLTPYEAFYKLMNVAIIP